MLKVQSHSTTNATSISQWAAIEALRGPQDSVASMLKEYTARREWLLKALADIPGIVCNEPEGAFYAFPKVRGTYVGVLQSSAEFSDRLLQEEQTVVTDGAGFGAEGYVRISYATSMEQLEEGMNRLRRFVSNRAT